MLVVCGKKLRILALYLFIFVSDNDVDITNRFIIVSRWSHLITCRKMMV